jgi:small subunit ribosomal protein S16
MAVKIRLARVGRHKDPFYRIVAADSRYARDGRYIEQVGFYDPSKPEMKATVDEALAMKWLLQGAQPSDTVRMLFKEHGLMTKFAETKLAIKKSGK